MYRLTAVVCALGLAAGLAGCSSQPSADDYTVTLEPPNVVNNGEENGASPCVPGPQSPSSCQ
ncbi:hypothetical protein [Larsenimonas rhizosphaerae]|uniref:hypothetical protein n=1 Tax=Larsenimonas rhizosphaerae TaxID=2944682 RepID=UPI0020335A46|nr:hypothetical protein [Larsenimonas rhizosphaerae]MCM2130879.1 hypothetical protein [Larsenimonas rhizosphaerae]